MTQLELAIAPLPPPRAALPPPPPYIVALCESDLDARDRIKAELRFCRALEDRLGTPEEIASLLRQLQGAEEEGRALTDEEEAMARNWQRAHVGARLASLQDLAAISGAWFDVRVS